MSAADWEDVVDVFNSKELLFRNILIGPEQVWTRWQCWLTPYGGRLEMQVLNENPEISEPIAHGFASDIAKVTPGRYTISVSEVFESSLVKRSSGLHYSCRITLKVTDGKSLNPVFGIISRLEKMT